MATDTSGLALLNDTPSDDTLHNDRPIPYIDRVRTYYAGLGYGAPYVWARLPGEVPFTPLPKPLAQCRIAIATTAAPYQPGKGEQGPGAPYNAAIKFYEVYSPNTAGDPDLRICHVAIDWDHTTAEDQGTYFPLAALRDAHARGRIGTLAPRFHGVPTHRSQRTTMTHYAPEVVRRCLEDEVDAVVLVPNCPVCHQTMVLTARALEAAGIATVVMGCAKDIVEYIGTPRLLFSDFPLGNGCGRPNDRQSQADTLEFALRLLEHSPGPRTTMQSPLRWASDPAWKLDYSNISRLSPEEIARRRAEFDAVKHVAKQVRQSP